MFGMMTADFGHGVVIVNTAQLNTRKSVLRLCVGSNSPRVGSDV